MRRSNPGAADVAPGLLRCARNDGDANRCGHRLTGRDPIGRHPEVHPSDAARVCGGWGDRPRYILWVRGFRGHTISEPGINLFKPLRGNLRAGRRRAGRLESRREGALALGRRIFGALGFRATPADSNFSILCGGVPRIRLTSPAITASSASPHWLGGAGMRRARMSRTSMRFSETPSRSAISATETPRFKNSTIRFSRLAFTWRAARRASADRQRAGGAVSTAYDIRPSSA